MALPPGPTAPAPIQTVRFIGRPVQFMEGCRDRFGETFTVRVARVGELVFISDPPSIKRLFSADRENRLPPGRSVLLEPVVGPQSLLLLQGEEHLRRRKLMLPSFHGQRMRAYEGLITEITERQVDSWPLGETFRLHPRMQAITLEVILRAVFGVDDPGRRERLRGLLVQLLTLSQSPAAQVFGLGMRRLGRGCPPDPPAPGRRGAPRSPRAGSRRSRRGDAGCAHTARSLRVPARALPGRRTRHL